jgi:hypothetical protein
MIVKALNDAKLIIANGEDHQEIKTSRGYYGI